MKATKKIVGAACALVAAVALSAGSTFAWFATSNIATATDMVVQATVPTNLLIAENYQEALNDQFKDTISFSGEAKKLSPSVVTNEEATYNEPTVSGIGLTGGVVYVLNATAYSEDPAYNNAGNASAYEVVGQGTASGTSLNWGGNSYNNYGKYVAAFDMTLANGASEGGKALDIAAKVEATGETDTIEFVRAGLLVKAGETYKLFSQANTGTHTWDYSDLITNLAAQKVATVSLLVWFDGQDQNCKVSGAQKIGDITFKVTYTASEVKE